MAANPIAVRLIAGGITLVSAVVIYFSAEGFGPKLDTAPHRALGEAVAQEALKLQGGSGHIFVFARDTFSHKNPFADAELEGFTKVLKKNGVKDSDWEKRLIKLNPILLVAVPPGDFAEVIRKSAENTVIVSLIGPPDLSEEQLTKIGDKRPKIIAVCAGWTPRQVNLRRIFDQHLLTTAVITRDAGGSGSAAFDRNFTLITSENVSELPLMASSAK